MNDFVKILDTTLRDGEQMPGINYNPQEKLKIARQLRSLGVKQIEVGFPIASESDFKAAQLIANEFTGDTEVVLCGLARATKKDIEVAYEALKSAVNPRIQILLPTSDVQIKHTLKNKDYSEVVEIAANMVTYAKKMVDDVEFTALDATRSKKDFLYQVLTVAIEAGATTLEIPDTVGYATPVDYSDLIKGIINNVPGATDVTIGTHCHDDLGLAVANTLAGIMAGARQVECTINGVGERAGNASLEEVVMAIKTRPDIYGVDVDIVTREIKKTSKLVELLSGIAIPPNKAIVGANAFSHASGMHQQAMLSDTSTYQAINPELVGEDKFKIKLGKLSGKHALMSKAHDLGIKVDNDLEDRYYSKFMSFAADKDSVSDEDLFFLFDTI
jgi:2-isopropylmalate synthase